MITLHADPLGDFLRSLAAVRDLDVDRVAAAHVGEVPDLAVRVDELLRHHDERLAEACAVLAAGAQTAWEVATGMTWKRGWDGLDVGLRRMAVGETHAHLLRLAVQGTVLRTPAGPDGVERWVLAEGSGTV
jgi:glyoxylase-like metal-dependent hydrolase (beta-lactamase superfamily II)